MPFKETLKRMAFNIFSVNMNKKLFWGIPLLIPQTILRRYIIVLIVMFLVMILLGGMTRLGGAGLSMVDWQPLMGILPPFTFKAWMGVFEAYQQSPEYLLINKGMTLEAFKKIFWLEYFHRLWGRLMGVVLVLSLVYALKSSLKTFVKPLTSLILLGLIQAIMGWIMVKSGLSKDPHVNPLCLVMHLGLAMLTFGFLIVLYFKTFERPMTFSINQKITVGFIAVTMLYGGLVAGHKAGLIYNTFPLMNGYFVPLDAWHLPLWKNFILNPATVQWLHRLLGLSTFCYLLLTCGRHPFNRWLLAGVSLQVLLGVLTLLYQVPLVLGVCHQLWAFCLLALSLKPKIGVINEKEPMKQSL